MKNIFFFLLSICLFISCAGNQIKQQVPFGEARIFAAQNTNLFNATRDYLFERSYEVIKTNMNTGEIETDFKPGAGWGNVGLLDDVDRTIIIRMPRGNGFTVGDGSTSSGIMEQRARIIAKIVKIDKNSTKLVINILCEGRDMESGWHQIDDDTRKSRIMYNQFFKNILAKVNRGIK